MGFGFEIWSIWQTISKTAKTNLFALHPFLLTSPCFDVPVPASFTIFRLHSNRRQHAVEKFEVVVQPILLNCACVCVHAKICTSPSFMCEEDNIRKRRNKRATSLNRNNGERIRMTRPALTMTFNVYTHLIMWIWTFLHSDFLVTLLLSRYLFVSQELCQKCELTQNESVHEFSHTFSGFLLSCFEYFASGIL